MPEPKSDHAKSLRCECRLERIAIDGIDEAGSKASGKRVSARELAKRALEDRHKALRQLEFGVDVAEVEEWDYAARDDLS